MRSVFAAGFALAWVLSADASTVRAQAAATAQDAAVATYERLATVIIEVRKTEDDLVNSILRHHYASAAAHLAAAEAKGTGRAKHLESAAEEITNIANEGDKRVQSIRQRLAKAGHTHNTDADTKEDFMFINSKEKKELLALARKVAQLGADADVAAVRKSFGTTFESYMKPE